MLAVYPQAIDFEQLPFANVTRLMAAMPVPVPAILGHSNELGIIALQDLGDVTLQAHLGAATRAEHAALYRQAVTLIDDAAAARRASWRRPTTCRTASPSTSRS